MCHEDQDVSLMSPEVIGSERGPGDVPGRHLVIVRGGAQRLARQRGAAPVD